jgi:hypothetical protein
MQQLFLAGLLTAGFASTAAAATPPSTGLGQSWPNATDVSASPHYHVYVFERLGVRYVQINDLNGNVRAAFGNAGGDIFGLPIGIDASRLATPSEPSEVPADSTGETVYQDDSSSVQAAPQPDGTIRLLVASECKNPAECSVHSP